MNCFVAIGITILFLGQVFIGLGMETEDAACANVDLPEGTEDGSDLSDRDERESHQAGRDDEELCEQDEMGGSWFDDLADGSGLDLIENITTGSGAILAKFPPTIKPGCTGYWRMNEGRGNKCQDASGNGNDGTVEGAAWVGGIHGHALEFDGAGDHVNLAGSEIAVQGNDDRTILAWVKTSNPGAQAIISTGTPAYNEAFNLVLGYGGSGIVGVMGYSNDYYPSSGKRVDDGKWHQVGVVYDGDGTVSTYVDGTMDNSGSRTYSTSGQDNYIGKSHHNGFEFYFEGLIDEAAVYDYDLTAHEILERYNETIHSARCNEGRIVTKEIHLPENMLWSHLSLFRTEVENTSLEISVIDGASNITVNGCENIDTEFLNLSLLNILGIGSVRLRANATGNGTSSPTLSSWGVEWHAENAWRDSFTGSSKSVLSGEFENVNSSVILGSNELVPTNNMVNLWHFNEGAGNEVKDDGSSGNDGTINGARWNQNGVYGSNLVFDGANSYVTTDNDLASSLGGTATLVAWIKTSAVGHGTFWEAPGIAGIEEAGGGNDIFWGWMDNTGRICMQTGNTAGAKSSDPVNDGQWHHIALTRHSGTGMTEVYVDGKLSNARNSDAGVKTLSFHSIGRIEDTGGTPGYFNGELDDVAIFDRVLDPVEIGRLSWKMPFQASLRSETVNLSKNQTWSSLSFGRTLPENTYLNISVHDASTGVPLESDTGLLPTGNIDLSGINPFQQKALYFSARFQSNGSTSPVLLDWGVNWTHAGPPVLIREIADLTILEDTPVNNLLDISEYFYDAYANSQATKYGVDFISDPANISLRLADSQLDVVELGGNFTGTISVRLNCTNAPGMVARSNTFNITVEDVNDAPVWTSKLPDIEMDEYSEYVVNWSLRDFAFDVEGDDLNFSADPLDYPMRVGIDRDMKLKIKALSDSRGNGIFNLRVFEEGNVSIGSNTTHTVSINSVEPPRVQLLSPGEDVTLDDTVITFEWSLLDPDGKLGNVRFDFYLGNTSEPALHTADVSETNFTVKDLDDNSTYYWNVVPTYEDVMEEQRSDTRQFTINSALGIPEIVLKSPENGSILSDTNVSLLWEHTNLSSHATDFQVYLGTSRDSMEMMNSTPHLQFRPGDLTYNTTYYWTVLPFNASRKGVCLNGIWSFRIAPKGIDLTSKLDLFFARDEVTLRKREEVTLNLTIMNRGYLPVTASLEVVGELRGFTTLSQHADIDIVDQISVLVILEWDPSFWKDRYELVVKASYSGKEDSAHMDIVMEKDKSSSGGTSVKEGYENGLWIIIPIIILVTLAIIIFIIVLRKRKERKEKEDRSIKMAEDKGQDTKKSEAEILYGSENMRFAEKVEPTDIYSGAGMISDAGMGSDAEAMNYFDNVGEYGAILPVEDMSIEAEIEYTPPPRSSKEAEKDMGKDAPIIIDAELVDADFVDIPLHLTESSAAGVDAVGNILPPSRPRPEEAVIVDAEIISESIDEGQLGKEIELEIVDVNITVESISTDENGEMPERDVAVDLDHEGSNIIDIEIVKEVDDIPVEI